MFNGGVELAYAVDGQHVRIGSESLGHVVELLVADIVSCEADRVDIAESQAGIKW
jgi:hypothetical protein